jgi:hypothetical protein
MSAVARFVACLALAGAAPLACGEPAVRPTRASSPSTSSSSSTDAGACARVCGTLARCGESPSCEDSCSHDVAPMRDGFAASFAACVEQELSTRGCGEGGRAFADRRASACYFATLDVYAERAPDTALDGFVRASCTREAACAGAQARGADDCGGAVRAQLKAGAAGRVLRALHPDVVAELATCIERAPCDDAGAVERCSERARALRTGAPRGISSATTPSDGGSR